MQHRIQKAFVDELEKIGYLGLAAKVAKQGLLKRVIKNPTVKGAASSLGQAAMWTAPSALMSRGGQPRQRPRPVTGGLS